MQRKNRLDDERASQHKAKLHGRQGDHGDDGIAQGMFEENFAPFQTLGPGGANVVRSQDLQHAGAGQAHKRRGGIITQGNDRHDKMKGRVAAGNGQPAQHHPENDDHDQAEPKRRHGLSQHRKGQGGAVNPGIWPNGGQNAERDGHDDGKQQGTDAQGHGHADPFANHCGHGLFHIGGFTQIPLQGPADPLDILHNQRSIEAVLNAHEFNFLVAGPLAGQGNGRIAGNPGQHETDQRGG